MFENDAGAILRDGLAYDRCSVGVVTDLRRRRGAGRPRRARRRPAAEGAAHPGGRGAGRRRGGAQCRRRARRRAGARCATAACVLYALDDRAPPRWPRTAQPAAARCSCASGDCVLAEGAAETRAAAPGAAGRQRRGRCRAEALLAAVAAAWAMGIVADLISAGVQTFGPAAGRARAPATPHAPLDDRKEPTDGGVPHPRAARAQPVEPPHGHRGRRALHEPTSATSASCRPSSRGCARCSRPSASPGRSTTGPLSHGPGAGAGGTGAAGRRPAARSPSAAPQPPPRPASTRWWSSTPRSRSAARRWSWRCELIAAAADGGSLRRRRRGGRAARDRRGPAPGPVHRLDRRRGHRARHPLPAPDRGQPGAVRLGRASSAASRPPRSTPPARSPSRSRRTRT